MAKKRKRRWVVLRYRKRDLAHNVQVAAQRFIHARGGTAILLTGVQVISMPGDPDHKYHLAVGVVGRRPVPAQKGK